MSTVNLDAIGEVVRELRGGSRQLGICGRATQVVEQRFGYPKVEGFYEGPDSTGRRVWIPHAWNRLPNGDVLDPTSDQFGFQTVRVIPQAEAGAYKPFTAEQIQAREDFREEEGHDPGPQDWPFLVMGSLSAQASPEHAQHGMICLRPSEAALKAFADMPECTEPIEDLHLTLYYLGEIDPGDLATQERYYRGLYDFALHAGFQSLTGKANGYGVFQNEQDSLVTLWDIPGIAEFRTRLIDFVKAHVLDLRQDNHGFTPHMTIANSDARIKALPDLPEGNPEEVVFASVWLAWGEDWTEVTLQ